MHQSQMDSPTQRRLAHNKSILYPGNPPLTKSWCRAKPILQQWRKLRLADPMDFVYNYDDYWDSASMMTVFSF